MRLWNGAIAARQITADLTPEYPRDHLMSIDRSGRHNSPTPLVQSQSYFDKYRRESAWLYLEDGGS